MSQLRTIRVDEHGPHLLTDGQCFRPPETALKLLRGASYGRADGSAARQSALLLEVQGPTVVDAGQKIRAKAVPGTRTALIGEVDDQQIWLQVSSDPKYRHWDPEAEDTVAARLRVDDWAATTQPVRIPIDRNDLRVEVTLTAALWETELTRFRAVATATSTLDPERERRLTIGSLSGVMGRAPADDPDQWRDLDSVSQDLAELGLAAKGICAQDLSFFDGLVCLEQAFFAECFRGQRLFGPVLARTLELTRADTEGTLVVTMPVPMAPETVTERDGELIDYGYLTPRSVRWPFAHAQLVKANMRAGLSNRYEDDDIRMVMWADAEQICARNQPEQP